MLALCRHSAACMLIWLISRVCITATPLFPFPCISRASKKFAKSLALLSLLHSSQHSRSAFRYSAFRSVGGTLREDGCWSAFQALSPLTSSSSGNQLYSTANDWLTAIAAQESRPLANEALAAAKPHCIQPQPELEWVMVAGLACWQLALYEQGLEYMNHVSVDRVRSVDFFGLLGMLCRRVPGHSKRAEEAYKLALEIDPKKK